MVNRALGIDLGDRRIGVAKTDPSGTLASPLEVIERSSDGDAATIKRIAELVEEWEIEVVVVGMPYRLDGSVGPAARAATRRVQALGEALAIPVETYDERMTTSVATRQLHSAGLDTKRQRGVVDMVAAAIILQGWLDSRRPPSDPLAYPSGDDTCR